MVPFLFCSDKETEIYLKGHLYCNRQCRTQSDQLCPQTPATHFSGINVFKAYVWHSVSKFEFPMPVRISTFTFISLCILHDITEICISYTNIVTIRQFFKIFFHIKQSTFCYSQLFSELQLLKFLGISTDKHLSSFIWSSPDWGKNKCLFILALSSNYKMHCFKNPPMCSGMEWWETSFF
jgi:hypothetical protein